jgi:hypothetical protein
MQMLHEVGVGGFATLSFHVLSHLYGVGSVAIDLSMPEIGRDAGKVKCRVFWIP